MTNSIGFVFHNEIFMETSDQEGNKRLKDQLGIVAPCHNVLKSVLKLDQVHTFGDFSKSQFIEKVDSMIEIASLNDLKRTHGC